MYECVCVEVRFIGVYYGTSSKAIRVDILIIFAESQRLVMITTNKQQQLPLIEQNKQIDKCCWLELVYAHT